MDIRDKQKIAAAGTTVRIIFFAALDRLGADPVEQLASVVPSTAKIEQYGWMGAVPGFSEWIGDRKLGVLRADGMVVPNRSWSNGIIIFRDTILDDQLGMVRPQIEMLAYKGQQHKPQLMVEVLANGFDGANADIGDGRSYDGAFLFSDDHKDGDGPVQSNLGTGPLSHATYAEARRRMQKLVDEHRDPFHVRPTHLLVGPDNEDVAREILENDTRIVQGVQLRNIYRGTAELLVSPRLVGPWANYWFLLDLSKPIKPLILQVRQKIEFHALDDMNSDAAFMRKEHKFGADARYAVAPALWQLAYGSKGVAA